MFSFSTIFDLWLSTLACKATMPSSHNSVAEACVLWVELCCGETLTGFWARVRGCSESSSWKPLPQRENHKERERDRSLYRQMALNDALQHANLPFGSVPGTSSESNRRYGFAWAAAKVGTRLSWLSLDVCGMFWIQFLERVQHVQKVFFLRVSAFTKKACVWSLVCYVEFLLI